MSRVHVEVLARAFFSLGIFGLQSRHQPFGGVLSGLEVARS
jgi:hypothetical protein